MAAEPIISSILNNLTQEGELLMGYHLPDETAEVAAEMRFLDGAEDGVRLYHMQAKPVDLTMFTSILYEIKAGRSAKAERSFRKAMRTCREQFIRMIDVIGPLQEWMNKHPNVMQDECFLRFALQQLMGSSDKDMIKLALAIVSNYGLEEKGQFVRIVRTLALSDEFTFQCVTMMRDWKNSNDEIFEVAKRVHGWGRIHAVHYLEPETQEIRHWMLTEGCKNEVKPAYSARDLAVKLPLVKILMDPALSTEEFDGISLIMEALLEDKTVPGISTIRDKEVLTSVYLKAAEGRVLTRSGVAAVSGIRAMQSAGNRAQ